MTYTRSCAQCGDPLDPLALPAKKYCCRTCLVRARNRRNRPTHSATCYAAAEAALNAIQVPKRPRRPVFRAATLAATPDEPAASMDRDDQLTGGAPAAGYAHAVRMVGVGI